MKAVLQHRPQQPLWSLEFSRSLEVVLDESSSKKEQEQAWEHLLALAQGRNLQKTGVILSWAQGQRRELERAQEQERVQELEQELGQAQKQEQKKVQALALAQKQAQESAQKLALELELDLKLAQQQVRKLERVQKLAHERVLALERVLELDVKLEQERELAQELKLAQERVSTKLIQTATKELKQVYGIAIQRDSVLETLLSGEHNRAQLLLQSGILLALSSVLLIAILVVLTKSRTPYGLPAIAHFIAFLPEECAAEMGALHQRLKKKGIPPWEIRRRLCEEFLFLLWAFYIQVRLDNIYLPWSDRTIDD